MNTSFRPQRLIALVAALGAALVSPLAGAGATTIDLGTSGQAANWLITGGGAAGAAAFQLGTNDISITSNAVPSGTFVAGGSMSQFTGAWIAQDSFFLPSNAVNISLVFSNLYGDDRVVLELNGAIIADTNVFQVVGGGLMSFAPGAADTSFTFDNTRSGTITSGFTLGGTNTLTMIVNNTGLGAAGGATTAITNTDGTSASLTASVTYSQNTLTNTSVPEPGSMLPLLSGLVGLGVLRGVGRARDASV